MTEWKNILYKEIENRKLYLDLFVPEDVPAPKGLILDLSDFL